jgi:hypothetical protein
MNLINCLWNSSLVYGVKCSPQHDLQPLTEIFFNNFWHYAMWGLHALSLTTSLFVSLGHETNTFRGDTQPVVLLCNNWSIWKFSSTGSPKSDVHSLYSSISYIYAHSSIHFKVREPSWKLKYATLQHSIYASFMCHEASVVKYWWGIRRRDGIFLQCCHLHATETTTEHHDTKTQKTKQDRAKTCTYHNTPHSM